MKNLNLTPRAQKLIKESLVVANENSNAHIQHLHVFIAFLNLKNSQIEDAFENFDLKIQDIKGNALKYLKKFRTSKKTQLKPTLSENCKIVFKAAKELSAKFDHKYIGLEHIFISLFEIPDDDFHAFLYQYEFQ